MTTLLIWRSEDKSGRQTIYCASDSRIRWTGTRNKWDHGRKLFYCKRHPIVIGFAGDALALSMVCSRIVDVLDTFREGSLAAADVPQEIMQLLAGSLASYTSSHIKSSELFLARTDQRGLHHLETLQFSRNSGCWSPKDIAPQKHFPPAFVCALGTGAKKLESQLKLSRDDPQSEQTRFLFWNFSDFVRSEKDKKNTGGNIQIAKLGFDGVAAPVGLLLNEQATVLGASVNSCRDYSGIDWRNENFELIDPQTSKRYSHQKRHARTKVDYA